MDFAIFSASSLFPDSDDECLQDDKSIEVNQSYAEREHRFPGMVSEIYKAIPIQFSDMEWQRYFHEILPVFYNVIIQDNLVNCLLPYIEVNMVKGTQVLHIREFDFHELNANLLWPGTFSFAQWLVEHPSWIEGRRTIELGSGTGALAIFLKKSFQIDITTSDQEIQDNIAHNCRVNGVSPVLPHVKHSWGDTFPSSSPDWDLVIASDILLYVKQYDNLIKSLCFLLKSYKPKVIDESTPKNAGGDSRIPCPPAFLMSWRRRIGKEDELLFFNGCKNAGLQVLHLGARVYCIHPTVSNIPSETM